MKVFYSFMIFFWTDLYIIINCSEIGQFFELSLISMRSVYQKIIISFFSCDEKIN
jgi:hypothetical protein